MLMKTKFAVIALGAGMLLFGAGAARAADCNSRIRNAERDVYRAENRYGPWSRQANEERNALRRAQESCGYYQNNGGWRNGWYRGDGDRDRDDRWVNRDRNRDRDNRWRRNDHDRDDRRNRDRNRNHDRDRGRDRD